MCIDQMVIQSSTVYVIACLMLSTLTVVQSDDDNRKSCFPTSMGYKDEWPFDTTAAYLPASADETKPLFEFYGPGKDKPIHLDYKNLKATSDSITFDRNVPTKFIIHGFGNSINESMWITDMRKAFLNNGDYNIVLVGWDTSFPQYVQAVCNSRVVAGVTVKVIDMLRGKGLDLSDLHLIGHSLGAHLCGYVGQLMGSRIGRITGLDPAGPWFDTFGEDARLDPSDAQFVDVIHTNGHLLSLYGGFGLLKESGHVDFYPNGGQKQPGCNDGLEGGSETLLEHVFNGETNDIEESVLKAVACSHGRAYEIFTESIKAGSCRFKSYPCPTYDDFERGQCISCGPKGCNYAGLQASPSAEGGQQFFLTNSESPLCSQSILVTITPSDEANDLSGTLVLYLRGTAGNDTILLAEGEIKISPLKLLTVVKPLKKDIGRIERGILVYHRSHFVNRRELQVASLTVKNLNTEKRYKETSPFLLTTGKPARLNLQEDTAGINGGREIVLHYMRSHSMDQSLSSSNMTFFYK